MEEDHKKLFVNEILQKIPFLQKEVMCVYVCVCLMKDISNIVDNIFLLTGLRIYTGEYKAQGPTLCPTEGRALQGPRALYSPV